MGFPPVPGFFQVILYVLESSPREGDVRWMGAGRAATKGRDCKQLIYDTILSISYGFIRSLLGILSFNNFISASTVSKDTVSKHTISKEFTNTNFILTTISLLQSTGARSLIFNWAVFYSI